MNFSVAVCGNIMQPLKFIFSMTWENTPDIMLNINIRKTKLNTTAKFVYKRLEGNIIYQNLYNLYSWVVGSNVILVFIFIF